MLRRHMWLASLVLGVGYVPVAVAQIPGVAPGTVSAATSAATAVGPVAPPQTLWSFLGCSWEQKEECRRIICKMPIGQLMGNASGPIGAISGGLIPSCCPQTPSAQELADKGPVGEAAKIKKSEAEAKERRAAVRYLGTVDCHYFPDAKTQLISALRSDTNECVRYEAALALRNGCCCTKETIEALIIVVSCSERDGNPRETSARVHAAARQALDKCMCCFEDIPSDNPKKKKEVEKKSPESPEQKSPEGQKKASLQAEPNKIDDVLWKSRPTGTAYYAKIHEMPMDLIVREGKRVLVATQAQAVMNSNSGNSLARLFDRASGVPETKGYLVQGGQPGKAELVAPKPTNLWEMLAGSSQPVIISSVPANSVVVESAPMTARVAPQPATMPAMSASSMPASTAMATASITSPVQTTLQSPPAMPVMRTAPAMERVTSPQVVPQPSLPINTPITRPATVSEVKTTPVIQPVQQVTVPTLPAPQAPVTRPVVSVTPPATPVLPPPVVAPAASSMQTTIQRISMGTVQDRIQALESLSDRQRATPELSAQLIKTVEHESNEQVRCAAVRAMVRTQVPAEKAIPVLSQLGMDLQSKLGKEANGALAQINMRLVSE